MFKYWDVKFKNVNLLSANTTKCANTLKQFFGNLPANCLRAFDHFVELALQGLMLYLNTFTLTFFCTLSLKKKNPSIFENK